MDKHAPDAPSRKPRRTLTEDEKRMLAVFKRWLHHCTSPYRLDELANAMIEYEIKQRIQITPKSK